MSTNKVASKSRNSLIAPSNIQSQDSIPFPFGLVLREYGSSGEDVSVNAVIIPRNWWAIPSEGRTNQEIHSGHFCTVEIFTC